MPVAPRTIAYHCELLHPPQVPDPIPIQRLHDELFRSPDADYRSFTVAHDSTTLSNPVDRPGAVSQAAFLTDRFRFVEEHTGLTVDDFAARVRRIAERLCAVRSIPVLIGQVVTVRTLVTPRRPTEGLEFMRQSLLRLGAELEDFGRPAAALGIRLAFPPTTGHPNAMALRVESVPGDARSLWIECQGSYSPLPVAAGLAAVEQNCHATYRFATGRAVAFLERFEGSKT
jgi:hypothetical protein